MDYNTLTTTLIGWGLDLKDTYTDKNLNVVQRVGAYRPALYFDHLDDTRTYFRTTMNNTVQKGGIGSQAYSFCKSALELPDLLTELAESLNLFVSPAIESDYSEAAQANTALTYETYFTTKILNTDAQTYQKNVAGFRERIPITRTALAQIAGNFKRNIATACARIYGDVTNKNLKNLFIDRYPALHFKSLVQIKSIGSDFHKGGKQVLLLTFSCTYEDEKKGLTPFKLKLVYKPGDLEADCLLTGDSKAAKRVRGQDYMADSLFEIYNTQLATYQAQNPNFTGLPLKTYRILPMVSKSAHKDASPLPLRTAYGYLEYLDNDVSGTASEIWGFYPWASSDFVLFYSESPESRTSIIQDFYRRAGAMAAVACTFSNVDLHIEKVRVKGRDPYFINMEVSLDHPVDEIGETRLLGVSGGVNGTSLTSQDYQWVIQDAIIPGQAKIRKKYEVRYYQNRLWSSRRSGMREMIPVDYKSYLAGFDDGMTVLKAAVAGSGFNDWFARMENVLVRYLPYGTSDFKKIQTQVFMDTPMNTKDKGNALETTITKYLCNSLTLNYEAFKEAGNTTANPNFIVLNQSDAGDDFAAMDIPIFYTTVGSTEIMNSNGAQVQIPAQMQIWAQPPAKKIVPVTAKIGNSEPVLKRKTFFAAPPTRAVVQTNQVNILLNQPKAQERITTLRQSIDIAFGKNKQPVAKIFEPIEAVGI